MKIPTDFFPDYVDNCWTCQATFPIKTSYAWENKPMTYSKRVISDISNTPHFFSHSLSKSQLDLCWLAKLIHDVMYFNCTTDGWHLMMLNLFLLKIILVGDTWKREFKEEFRKIFNMTEIHLALQLCLSGQPTQDVWEAQWKSSERAQSKHWKSSSH